MMDIRKENMSETVILVTNEGMGTSDLSLQTKLIKTYLKLISESELLPNAICFYTDGVKLVIENSPVLEELKQIETKGVRLVVCGTCLNHYGLTDNVGVGIVGGMTDIIEAQVMAKKVITL